MSVNSGVSTGERIRVKRLVAPLVVALGALTIQPAIAVATDSERVSPRFATYSVGGTNNSEATITMPAGFPSAQVVKTPSSTQTAEQLSIGSLPEDIKGPFRERFTEQGLSTASSKDFLFLPGSQQVGGSSTITITFDSPFPADHLGINIQDIDYEIVYMAMVGADRTTRLTFDECGLQSVYNSGDGQPSLVPQFTPNPDDAGFETACIKIFDKPANTTGASIWFVPTVAVHQIVLKETTRAAGSFGWFAADRPTPEITAATPTSVPTTYRVGSDPLAITPDMFSSAFAEHILVKDFPIDPIIQFRVTNDGGTGCTLGTNSPATLTATAAGTCTLEAFIPETPDYKEASFPFTLTITKPLPTVEWVPEVTEFEVTEFPFIVTPPPPPPSPSGEAYTFSTDSTSTSDCTVDAQTSTLTVPKPGTCVVGATTPETDDFAEYTITQTFTFTGATATPELAATGAPRWPLWAGALVLAGVAAIISAGVGARRYSQR